jgi:hypothetical protein
MNNAATQATFYGFAFARKSHDDRTAFNSIYARLTPNERSVGVLGVASNDAQRSLTIMTL